MRRLSACIFGLTLLTGCIQPPGANQHAPLAVYAPDLSNHFLLSHLDDSQINDPVLQQVVRAMRQDDFFRLTFEKASCGTPSAQYWAGFDNQYNIALEGDLITASMWYRLAADQGHTTAERALSNLNTQMTADEVAQAKRRFAHWQPAEC